MSTYSLLNNSINFSDAEERFMSLQFWLWDSNSKIRTEFQKWYNNKEDMLSVLNGYPNITEELLNKYILKPLYAKLSKFDIYDVSIKSFSDECLNVNDAIDMLNEVADAYNRIIRNLNDQIQYREERKANRGQVVGGGFGLSGAVKGMATAGAINMTTGMAHSIINSFGNASSEEEAKTEIRNLYKKSLPLLSGAICSCSIDIANQYMVMLNERVKNTYCSSFNSDKASALLANAKNIKDKRIELLVESFSYCPWNYELYEYIFNTYPEERKSLLSLANRFKIDLSETIEELLNTYYTDNAKKNEILALEAKRKILSTMSELGVNESKTLDNLEIDCLNRICVGWETSDESTCNSMRDKVKQYDALDKNKQPFLDNIQKRIEEIWAKEDGDIFDNYIMNLNITKSDEIKSAIKFVESKSRTKDSEKYITMLNHCNYSNFKKARKYYKYFATSKIQMVTRFSGAIIAIIGLVLLLGMDNFSFYLQILPMILGVALQIHINGLYDEYYILTVRNKIYPKILSMSDADFEKEFKGGQDEKNKNE